MATPDKQPAHSLSWLLLLAVLAACSAHGMEANSVIIRDFLDRHCITCHGDKVQKGQRRFDQLPPVPRNADEIIGLQEVLDQLNAGDMPPKKEKQPAEKEVLAVVEALNRELERSRQEQHETAGRTVLRRLNRREYLNTIRDLFAFDMRGFNPAAKFPSDQVAEQMDNQGDVLQTSGYLLGQYLESASLIVEKALGTAAKPAEQTWTFDQDFLQQDELDLVHRMQYGLRYLCLYEVPDTENHEGGYAPIHGFEDGVPADGFYEITIKAQALHRINPYNPVIFKRMVEEPFRLGVVPGDRKVGRLFHPQPVEPLLAEVVIKDGEPQVYQMRVWLDAGKTPRFIFPNGMASCRHAFTRIVTGYQDRWPAHERGKTIMPEARRIVLKYGQMPHIRIHEVKVSGPLFHEWPPPARRMLVGEGDGPMSDDQAREALEHFASRAFRGPVRSEVMEQLTALASRRRQEGRTPLEALKDAMKAALCSPQFIYLEEEADAGGHISAHALAARLSYFLWASMPDAELRGLADTGEILKDAVLLAQVRRMLADEKSGEFVTGLTDSWLSLRNLGDTPPDRDAFEKYYFQGLKEAMKTETQMFFRHIIDSNRDIGELLDADYAFINQPLATLYGLGKISTAEDSQVFRRVQLSDRRRGGLLGQASILTVSANGVETSPVTRGNWVLKTILGTPTPPPPDDIPAIDPDVRGANAIRDVLARHRTHAACNECHRKIDPLGFAMENFDPIGAWRTHYPMGKKTGPLIDPSGELANGRPIKDIVDLKDFLMGKKDQFAAVLTGRMMSYACGRKMENADRLEVDKIARELKARHFGMRDLVELIVTSPLFKSK